MSHRFYLDSIPDSDTVWIEGPPAHHMLHVLRMKPGDDLVLFTGKGAECAGRIESVERERALIRIESVQAIDREPSLQLTIASAIPKGKRMDFMVQKCAELGVNQVIPIITTHSSLHRPPKEQKIQRWQEISMEASRQCGRNRIMHVSSAVSLAEAIEGARDKYDSSLILSTAKETQPIGSVSGSFSAGQTILCIIGPEGGFSDEELQIAAANGCEQISLGRTILRVETAAVAAAALICCMT